MIVIASIAKQSRNPGSPRRFAARDDGLCKGQLKTKPFFTAKTQRSQRKLKTQKIITLVFT
jgi:hypothetical protein